MEKIRVTYKLYISGNDLDAKAAQKLQPGNQLTAQRLDDELDTYEILLLTPEGKELDMLSYGESIGVAPFIDNGDLKINGLTVTDCKVIPGKTRAKDETVVTFEAEYEYDPYRLKPETINDVTAFIPNYDIVLAMAIHKCIESEDYPMEKMYLNCYELDCPLYEGAYAGDINIEPEEFSFYCSVLFNPEFTNCKISAKLYNDNEEIALLLNPESQLSAINLVNHTRIFEGEDPVDCVIDN